MAEFKPFEMIMRIEYGGAVDDGDVMQVCCKAKPVAELVRCKECKYKPSWREGVKEEFRDGFELIFPDWRDNPCPCQCDDGFYAHMPDDNWFCANGKRKNNA